MEMKQSWDQAVYRARYEFRCACVPSQMIKFDAKPVINGVADIAYMRLLIVFSPLLKSLDDLERKVGELK